MIPENVKKAIAELLRAYRETGNKRFLDRAAKLGWNI